MERALHVGSFASPKETLKDVQSSGKQKIADTILKFIHMRMNAMRCAAMATTSISRQAVAATHNRQDALNLY